MEEKKNKIQQRLKIHTHSLDLVLIIKSLIRIRNLRLHNWLIIKILKDLLGSLIRG